MSAFWVNIYLKTAILMTDVFTQTYEVARRVLNTKLESVRLTDSQEAERVKSAYAQKQIVVFPEKNGLVSFNLPRFSASAYLMDLSPEMSSDGMMSGEMKQLLTSGANS